MRYEWKEGNRRHQLTSWLDDVSEFECIRTVVIHCTLRSRGRSNKMHALLILIYLNALILARD